MVAKKRAVGICAYCGKKRHVTDDHVSPKNLFPKPRPSDLITVPICDRCNRGTSKDDEYFRLVVSMQLRAAQHPDAQRVLPVVCRSLDRPGGKGLRTDFLNRVQEANLMSPLGLYRGKAGVYDVDYPRLERVAERIARGLFFHHMGKVVPSTCGVRAWYFEGRWLLDEVQMALRDIAGGVQGAKSHKLGSRTFRYKFAFIEESDRHPHSSAWLFSVYEAVEFLVLIVDGYSPTMGSV
jgi:hypothetical protein